MPQVRYATLFFHFIPEKLAGLQLLHQRDRTRSIGNISLCPRLVMHQIGAEILRIFLVIFEFDISLGLGLELGLGLGLRSGLGLGLVCKVVEVD